ncbi:hypothetical protein TCAL_10867, partial [Tigriopus californicus]
EIPIASHVISKELNQTTHIELHRHIALGSQWLDLSQNSKVTLFTHTSMEYMGSLVRFAEQWQGPLSVAIYVPGVDFHLTKLYINYLQDCHSQLMSRMTVHFDFETSNIPISLGDCPSNDIAMDKLVSWRTEKVIRFLHNTPYPNNILRNLARDAVQNEYLMMVDMELIPSQNMFQGLEEFLRKNETKDCFTCAYVIPQFEIESSAYWELPKAKKQLITMIKSNLAEPLYHTRYKPFSHCVQGYKWLDIPDRIRVEIAFTTNYTFLCEPIVVIRSTAPGYQNEFRGFGFDRASHIIHLYLTDYSLHVLNPLYFLHLGRKLDAKMSQKQYAELEINCIHLKKMLHQLQPTNRKDVCADLFKIVLPESFTALKLVYLSEKLAL